MSKKCEHSYGSQVHLLDNTFLNGILAKLCAPTTFQPEINQLVEILYSQLLTVVMNEQFPKEMESQSTRMADLHPDQNLSYERICPNQKVISVNIARAGTYPSHVSFNLLHYALNPGVLRQDHLFAARAVNSQNQITGTEISATKIGGDQDQAIVLFPDPMGATGSTLMTTIAYYKKSVPGIAKKMIALHLIVTPEYLKKVLTHHPDVVVYALRLDRGLSGEAALKAPLGKMWDQERGLNDKGYIVPGGGGFGEIMNNSFV